jgi:hypothetical protein
VIDRSDRKKGTKVVGVIVISAGLFVGFTLLYDQTNNVVYYILQLFFAFLCIASLPLVTYPNQEASHSNTKHGQANTYQRIIRYFIPKKYQHDAGGDNSESESYILIPSLVLCHKISFLFKRIIAKGKDRNN